MIYELPLIFSKVSRITQIERCSAEFAVRSLLITSLTTDAKKRIVSESTIKRLTEQYCCTSTHCWKSPWLGERMSLISPIADLSRREDFFLFFAIWKRDFHFVWYVQMVSKVKIIANWDDSLFDLERNQKPSFFTFK